MKKLLIPSLLFLPLMAYGAGDVVIGATGGTTSNTTQTNTTLQDAGIYDLGGRLLIDRALEVTGGFQSDKYTEWIGTASAPTTPASGHARQYLNKNTNQLCLKFDDGTVSCLGNGAGTVASATQPILFNSGTGNISATLISLSTGIVGNLGVSHLNTGLSASATTYWRGDGSWGVILPVSVREYAATGNGLTDDTTAFANANNASSGTVLVPAGNYLIGSNVSITNTLVFAPGAFVTILSTVTLTLNQTPVANPDQVLFSGSRKVQITNARTSVYAEWWGAKAGPIIAGGLTESCTGFNLADASLPNGGHIEALLGVYQLGCNVTLNNASLSGQGWYTTNNGTLFLPTNSLAQSTTALFTINVSNKKFHDFMIAANVDPSSFTAITTGPSGTGNTYDHIYMKIVGNGLWIKQDNGSVFHDILVVSASSNCILLGGVSGQYVGDTHWDQIVLAPKAGIGDGWVFDGNVSAQYIHRLTEVGGVNGMWIRGTGGVFGGSDFMPSNLNLWNSIINANTYGIRFTKNLDALIQDNTINGNTVNIYVQGQSSGAVDGIELDNNFLDGATFANVQFSTGINLNINGGSYFNTGTSSASIYIGSNASGLVSVSNIMCGVPGEWGNTPVSGKYCVYFDSGSMTDTTNLGGTVVQGHIALSNIAAFGMSQAPFANFSNAPSTGTYISGIDTGLQPNFSYANRGNSSVFGSSVALRDELLVGTTFSLGQSAEKFRLYSSANNNLVMAGGQALSTGGTILGMSDSNTLNPLQLRGSKLYWSGSDGNIGINNTVPTTLLHLSTGTLTVDGTNGQIITGSMTVNNEAFFGATTALGQTREIARFHNGTNQNIFIAGGQSSSTGGTVGSVTDANALAPFQIRGSEIDSNDGPVRATAFTDTSSRSIFGNFVGSNTVTGGSSMTVTLSGYTFYHAKVRINNASGAAGTVFVRFSTDASTNYSYSNLGWHLTASTGSACGNVAASAFALSNTGATGVQNDFNSGVEFSADFDFGNLGNNQINGNSKYQEVSANSIVNFTFGGYQNSSTLSSIQVWVGKSSGCTGMTDPLTGTTGSLIVWGSF